MTSKEKLGKILELFINDREKEASELLHEWFVERAREINQKLIEEDDKVLSGDEEIEEVEIDNFDDEEDHEIEDLKKEIEDLKSTLEDLISDFEKSKKENFEDEDDETSDEDEVEVEDEDEDEEENDEETDEQGEDEEDDEDLDLDFEDDEDSEEEDEENDHNMEVKEMKTSHETKKKTYEEDDMNDEDDLDDNKSKKDLDEEDDVEDILSDENLDEEQKDDEEDSHDDIMLNGGEKDKKENKEDDDYKELEESINDLLRKVNYNNTESEVGSGGSRKFLPNKVSPIPQKKIEDRMGGTPINRKDSQPHKGYDLEDPPKSKKIGTHAVNVENTSKNFLHSVSKLGDPSAILNKVEGGKGNMVSPVPQKPKNKKS